MFEVTSPAQVPAGPHYAIILYETIPVHDTWEEGGKYTDQTFARHWVTEDVKVWKDRITKLSEPSGFGGAPTPFVVFKVQCLATIKRTFTVDIN